MRRRANPDEETTNWRAVCGRTARAVRREGRAKALLYPYRSKVSQVGGATKLRDSLRGKPREKSSESESAPTRQIVWERI